MSDQQIDGLTATVKALIPSSCVKVGKYRTDRLDDIVGFKAADVGMSVGGRPHGDSYFIWVEVEKDYVHIIEVSREKVALTRREQRVLERVADGLKGLLVSSPTKHVRLAERIASLVSLEYLVVAKLMRTGRGTNYWTPANVLLQLQELTYDRYEGRVCTSGCVYTSKPEMYVRSARSTPYQLLEFDNQVSFGRGHFSKPASYRYVDGRNGFYLLDNQQHVRGVLRLEDPKSFDVIDRSSHHHLKCLVEAMPGRPWIAFSDLNQTVNVLLRDGTHLRWEKGRWHVRDREIVRAVLSEHGCSEQLVDELSCIVFALSDLRAGALMLIPDCDSAMPKVAGHIDSSELGCALRGTMALSTFSQLAKTDTIVGVLSSDGLTRISKDGRVMGCGEIVRVDLEVPVQLAGGGRTQAAVAASEYGLSIKVSEDGPISLYKGREHIVTI